MYKADQYMESLNTRSNSLQEPSQNNTSFEVLLQLWL